MGLLLVAGFALVAVLLAACGGQSGVGSTEPNVVAPCVVGGCSSQLCASEPLASHCEWLPEYACYRTARCEPQSDGSCGWTQTPELVACIAAARGG